MPSRGGLPGGSGEHETGTVRHRDVDHEHVDEAVGEDRAPLGDAAGLPDDREVGFAVDHPTHRLADEGVVVDHHHIDRHDGWGILS